MAMVLFLGGCKVGPNYTVPEAQVADAWLETDNEVVKSEESDNYRWWEVFDDPVLNDLVERAYDQNLSLQIAGLRILEARARRGISAGNFFPQVQQLSARGGAFKLSDNDPNALPLDRNFNDVSVGFDAVWELDFWGKFRRGIESADAALLSSVANYDEALVSLIGEVAATYVRFRMFEKRLVLARANVELQKRTLEIATVRFNNGAVTELDVTEARSNLENTESLAPNFADGVRQTRITLSILLGVPPSNLEELLHGPGGIPTAPAEIVVGIPADLLRRRPDVRSAERIAAAMCAQIGVAKADFYPAVTVIGSTGFRTGDSIGADGFKKDIGNLFDSDSFYGFIGLDVSWPILNYGRIANNVRVKDAHFQQAIVNYQDTVLRAAAEVESGLSSYLQNRERAEHLSLSVAATERSVELSLQQYRDGTATFLRALTAQTSLVVKQDQLATTESRIALHLISTYKSLGGGWEIRQGREFIPEPMQQQMAERTDWGKIMAPDYDQGSDMLFARPDSDVPSVEPQLTQSTQETSNGS
jgi:NodT family efflux transporter outer membrane factor (OMF) lipoprotein